MHIKNIRWRRGAFRLALVSTIPGIVLAIGFGLSDPAYVYNDFPPGFFESKFDLAGALDAGQLLVNQKWKKMYSGELVPPIMEVIRRPGKGSDSLEFKYFPRDSFPSFAKKDSLIVLENCKLLQSMSMGNVYEYSKQIIYRFSDVKGPDYIEESDYLRPEFANIKWKWWALPLFPIGFFCATMSAFYFLGGLFKTLMWIFKGFRPA